MLFELASEHRSRAYKVLELREKLIGGKMSGDKLEKILNEHGAQGWQLKAVTASKVKGRVGPGGVEGLLVTFERPSPYVTWTACVNSRTDRPRLTGRSSGMST